MEEITDIKQKYIVALDQGTTSSRAIVFDHEQNIVAVGQKEFNQIYPQPGWVEHDPMEIWATQYGVLQEALIKAGITMADVAGIGITNQRETTIVWEKPPGNRFTMQLFGSAVVQRICVTNLKKKDGQNTFSLRQG